MPDLPNQNSKSSKFLKYGCLSALVLTITNLFGLLSNILGSFCDIDAQCRGIEQTRINLLSIHKIGSSDGWSYSLLGDETSGLGGTLGGIGIPDIVAISVLAIATFILFRKK